MRYLAALAGVMMAVLATPAHAGDRHDLPQLQRSLRFGITGIVPADCSLSQPTHDVAIEGFQDPATDTIRRATANLPFTVSCNTPVSVSLASRDGGLKFQGAGTSDKAFATLIRYSAHVRLPGQGTVLNCRSDAMASDRACRTDVADTTIEGAGSIEVRIKASDELVLAGKYQDRLTITLTPTLGGCST